MKWHISHIWHSSCSCYYTQTHTHHQTLSQTVSHWLCFYSNVWAKVKWGFGHLSRVSREQVETRGLAPHAVCLCCLGNTYKYQAGNRMNALLWFKHLSAACQSNRQQVGSHTHTHTGHCCLCFVNLTLFPRCQPIWCHLSDPCWGVRLSEGERKQTRRMGRSTDWVVGAFTAMNPHRRFSDSSPWPHCSLTCHHCLNPACLCACLWKRLWVCVDEGDCFGCTDYWTRTCTTALVSRLLSVSFVQHFSRALWLLLSDRQTVHGGTVIILLLFLQGADFFFFFLFVSPPYRIQNYKPHTHIGLTRWTSEGLKTPFY